MGHFLLNALKIKIRLQLMQFRLHSYTLIQKYYISDNYLNAFKYAQKSRKLF